MDQVLQAANSLPLWIIAIVVVTIPILQAVIFSRFAAKTAPAVGMTRSEVKSAFRTGLISSIGPSLGILIIAVSLLTILGGPITLMRIGIMGSAAYELTAANIGAKAFGVTLGGEGFDVTGFTVAVWTMCIGGLGWLLVAALFTKPLGKVQKKVTKRNTKIATIVSSAALVGAFGFFAAEHAVAGTVSLFVTAASALTMIIMMIAAKKFQMNWMREWSLGAALVIGMSAGYIATII
ncbi:DUF5058 family protein [Alteribacillus sp. YIM 98480]|uniref:DUF5058 family protein n=1 Tax=Alteribacillus sp. YIM 98480 TaxID=2606599 RepID=UPI00131B7970|nr:DUF5058 family protein [Alteribacillus sp. YIM 98480]